MAEPATTAAHILVVDDEPGIRSVLRRGLEAEGFVVSEAANRAQLMQCLDTQDIDLITLDIDLGAEHGLVLAREIRGQHNVPIIMITGMGEPADRLTGLEFGADDYIAKPFKLREVILRVRSVLRRYELEARISEIGAKHADTDERYNIMIGVLDVPRRELRDNQGALVALTDMEFDLLVMLARHPKKVLSRDEIMEALNGRSWSPLDRTIDGHVARLRHKIEPEREDGHLIKTVRGVGYVLAVDVLRLTND